MNGLGGIGYPTDAFVTGSVPARRSSADYSAPNRKRGHDARQVEPQRSISGQIELNPTLPDESAILGSGIYPTNPAGRSGLPFCGEHHCCRDFVLQAPGHAHPKGRPNVREESSRDLFPSSSRLVSQVPARHTQHARAATMAASRGKQAQMKCVALVVPVLIAWCAGRLLKWGPS